jgi:hypothetical protein
VQTPGFLAFRAAFAKPFCAATVSDLVGDALAGPYTLESQPELFTAEMNEVSCLSHTSHVVVRVGCSCRSAVWASKACALCVVCTCATCLTCALCALHRCWQCLPPWMT